MLTPKEIAQLKPAERTQLFDSLSKSVFRTQAETVAALDIALRTLQVWRADDTVPVMALLALQSCTMAANKPSALLQDARQIAAQLETTATAIADTAQLLAGIIRRMPGPS